MTETTFSVLTPLCSGIHFYSAEKRIADYILKNPEKVVDMTSAQLARISASSEATVTRLCKKLGFENYRTFKFALMRDMMAQKQSVEIGCEVRLEDVGQSLQNILANKISELQATIDAIDEGNLKQILALLQKASIIEVAAVGNTIPVAMDAAFKFNQLGLRTVTSEISEKLSAFALTLTPEDVLFLISYSGKSRRLHQIAAAAKQNHTPIILITCNQTSPLAEMADHLLICTNREKLLTSEEFAFSKISAITIVEVLYHFLLVSIAGARDQVRRHEALMKHDKEIGI